MSNNFFNFKLPEFYEKYGSDWSDFITTMDDNTDHVFDKVWQLYWLNDINLWTEKVTEHYLDTYKIDYDSSDTFQSKKSKFKTGVTKFKDKALASIYIEAAQDITGIAGDLYSGYSSSSWVWSESFIGDSSTAIQTDEIMFGGGTAQFRIYFDVKTTDSGELDLIQDMLEDEVLRPAFYDMYLIDSSFNILRTIT